jgi:hypothetical protein
MGPMGSLGDGERPLQGFWSFPNTLRRRPGHAPAVGLLELLAVFLSEELKV